MNRHHVRVIVGGDVGPLRATLWAANGIQVATECEGVAAVVAAAEAHLGNIVVIPGDLPDLDRTAVASIRARGIGVVGAVDSGDLDTSRQLRRMGVDARIFFDSDPEVVSRALQTVRTHPRNPRRSNSTPHVDGLGRSDEISGVVWRQASKSALPQVYGVARRTLITVWGPAGAPGRSTIAAGIASAVARRGLETLLVDADVYGGAQATMLALLDESPGLLAAIRAAERGALNVPVLADLSIEVAPRLRVLTGIDTANRWPEVRTSSFENVLGLARDLARVTVVDCGFCLEDDAELSYDTYAPRRNAVTLAALSAADEIVVVGRDDVVGRARLEAGLLELNSIGGRPTQIVLNQVMAKSPLNGANTDTGRRGRAATPLQAISERRTAAWRRLAEQAPLHVIPHDVISIQSALQHGLPVGSLSAPSSLNNAFDSLSRALVTRRGFV